MGCICQKRSTHCIAKRNASIILIVTLSKVRFTIRVNARNPVIRVSSEILKNPTVHIALTRHSRCCRTQEKERERERERKRERERQTIHENATASLNRDGLPRAHRVRSIPTSSRTCLWKRVSSE